MIHIRISANGAGGCHAGGCIVEGKDLSNAYRWKGHRGGCGDEETNWNRWQEAFPETPAVNYHQTYGLGFFEFFQLCEGIVAAPVPVINCGMACQYMTGQLVPISELDPWVQDAIDLIEFANGPVTTKWGKLRAEMGHPESFDLTHVGIGNEQWDDAYFERYAIFHRALKASHREITLITSSGPAVDDEKWKFAWKKFRNGTPAEIVDERYYRPPDWFLDQSTRYDRMTARVPRFSGPQGFRRGVRGAPQGQGWHAGCRRV